MSYLQLFLLLFLVIFYTSHFQVPKIPFLKKRSYDKEDELKEDE